MEVGTNSFASHLLGSGYIVSIAWFNAISLLENARRLPLETDLARRRGKTSPG